MISIKNVIHVRQVGLTAMRQIISGETQARIVLSGRIESYKGIVPGIAEEALMLLEAGQPLFLPAGFGGCARDIAEALSLVEPWTVPRTGSRTSVISTSRWQVANATV